MLVSFNKRGGFTKCTIIAVIWDKNCLQTRLALFFAKHRESDELYSLHIDIRSIQCLILYRSRYLIISIDEQCDRDAAVCWHNKRMTFIVIAASRTTNSIPQPSIASAAFCLFQFYELHRKESLYSCIVVIDWWQTDSVCVYSLLLTEVDSKAVAHKV